MFLFIVLNLKLIPPVDKKLPRSKLKTFFLSNLKLSLFVSEFKKKKTPVGLKTYAKIKTSFSL